MHPTPTAHTSIPRTLHLEKKYGSAQAVELKINSQKFVFCRRCHFIQLKLFLNDRQSHKHKKSKEKVRRRECEGEGAIAVSLFRLRTLELLPLHFHASQSHLRTFVPSLSCISALKEKVRRAKWPIRTPYSPALCMGEQKTLHADIRMKYNVLKLPFCDSRTFHS